ncbi:MAG: hypothetical protein HXS44_00515 [Theionarchaea archaeon]|nr:hypothetical protein [Theionarchaea archaeon]
MQTIELLKKNVSGVEGSFLIKNNEIIECDLEREKMQYLTRNISFLIEIFLEKRRDIKKISIAANLHCQVFFEDPYVLGTVASEGTNFPLLDMISNKLLFTIEESPERTMKAVDEIVQRMDSFIR